MHFLTEAFSLLSQGCGPFALMYQIYSDTGFLAVRAQTMPIVMQEVQERLTQWILKEEKK